MTNNLTMNFFRLLNKKTKSTSIRKLEKRGHKHVSVLNVKELKHLIQEAVDKSLGELGLTLSQEDLMKVNEHTRQQLLKIINDRNELEASVKYMAEELDQLKNNSQNLKTELEINQRILKREEERVQKNTLLPYALNLPNNIESTLQGRLMELFADKNIREDLQNDAIRITLDILADEREEVFKKAKSDHEDKIVTLRRRIKKLNNKLIKTEDLLHRANNESLIDSGVSSEYKTVQGLKDSSNYKKEKKALLTEIFNLNRDLKETMAEI